MSRYFKVMLGKGSVYANEAINGGYIGVDFIDGVDLSKENFTDNFRDFNKKYIPIWQKQNPEKSKVGAGLACGQLWTVAYFIQVGDTILSPIGRGAGVYKVGEVVGDYEYCAQKPLQHRRRVNWYGEITRESMSPELRNSSGGITTIIYLNKYTDELDLLIEHPNVKIMTNDETIEDASEFALEKHLEDFLVHNWTHTELGKKYDIFEQDGELIGQQYPSDTGPVDILAVSKDKKEILVVELKRGRISDVVVGQIQRYMGYVKDELAEKDQVVKGVIIALEDDLRLRRALSVARDIEFMTYEIKFNLKKQK